MQVSKYSKAQVEEVSVKIDQLSNSMKRVNFKDNSNDRNTDKGFRELERKKPIIIRETQTVKKYRNNSLYYNVRYLHSKKQYYNRDFYTQNVH